jgi:uncharacterized protein DUF6600/FecR-like protein
MLTPTQRKSTLIVALLACALVALPAFAESQARIVRLSDVHGQVQIDKNTGLGFENAFANLPITQGTQLRTSSNGRAEIEFEDGSSMRLAPDTSVEFSRLGLSDSGKRISQVQLVQGLAYVDWLGKDDFNLNFSRESISLDHAAHFRVDATPQATDLAVFKGDVNVDGPSGKLIVEKKKTATFNAEDDDKYTLANKVAESPFDSWDHDAIGYHDQYAKNNQAQSPYGYGMSDLNYYGSFSNVPGYGMMWQPFFTGVGWDPFMDGAWSFYPGYGYMFASAYPWGWMPYRYGNWMFLQGMGWMWQPGGWNSWAPIPRYTATNLTHVTPLIAPASGAGRTVLVGRAASSAAPLALSRMTVNTSSAGMGIPRGSMDNLKSLNHEVAKHGFAEVRPMPQFSASSPNRGGGLGGSRSSMAGSSMGMGHASASSSGHSSGATAGGSHK